MNDSNNVQIKRLGWIIFSACIIISFGIVIYSIITFFTTGTLVIHAANNKAGIVVTAMGKGAVYAGEGSAKVRLKPGNYQISAIENGEQSNAIAQVYDRHTTNSRLGLVRSFQLPTAQNIDFKNSSSLINAGLTSEQISDLQEYFFQFNHTTKTVDVISESVQLAPYNPNVDTSFSINFDVSINNVAYKATVTYTNLTDIQLYLYNDQTNSLVFKNQ
jgi:hypothetical protein